MDSFPRNGRHGKREQGQFTFLRSYAPLRGQRLQAMGFGKNQGCTFMRVSVQLLPIMVADTLQSNWPVLPHNRAGLMNS